jgi:hypothetical protein
MKKRIPLFLSIIFIISGTILLIPWVSYLLLKILNNQFITNVSTSWAIFINIAGAFGFIVDLITLINLLKKEPPALVRIPFSVIGKIETPIIGRDRDLNWLRSINKDSLLIGQPGSGKTFLLYNFAKDNAGLFVERNDINSIAHEFKKRHPKFIIIDVAQNYIDLLNRLVQLRGKKKLNFIIILTCWPFYRTEISEKLNLPSNSIHLLGLLSRDERVQIIKNAGLMGSEELIREIVNQSAGRPGLAITLTEMCLKGGINDVLFGEVLTRDISTYLSKLVGEQAIIILAAFAVGGETGLSMKAVSTELQVSLPLVKTIVTNAASGLGLIQQTPQGFLAVFPPILRYALVRDKFFGAEPLDIQPFIDSAYSLHNVVETLLGAKSRGAKISQEFMIANLEKVNSWDLWEGFAFSGTEESKWVLDNHPEQVVNVAKAVLFRIPDVAIPMLLSHAEGDERQLHSTPDHPLRLIHDWVLEANPGQGKALQRREQVLKAALSWLKSGATPEIGYQALKIALSPEFDNYTTDPGSGNLLTLHYGLLTLEEIRSLENLWNQALPLILQYPPVNWTSIREIVGMFAYPRHLEPPPSAEAIEATKSLARNMILGLLPLIQTSQGLSHWAHHLSLEAKLKIPVPTDSTFEILYPKKEYENWHEAENRQLAAIRELASEWVSHDPIESIEKLFLIEKEARIAGTNWPRWTPYFCAEMAKQVNEVGLWAMTGINRGLSGDLIGPFLAEAIKKDSPGWIEMARACLKQQELKYIVIQIVIANKNIPDDFLTEVFTNVDGTEGVIESLGFRKEITEERVNRLLAHENPSIARAAARGEWMATPHKIRDSVRENWEKVITLDFSGDYYLEEVFRTFPHLAELWLKNIFLEEAKAGNEIVYRIFRLNDALHWAALALGVEYRKSLLMSAKPSRILQEIIFPLVGDDDELYRCLLNNIQLKEYHLFPLFGGPNEAWARKAIIVIEAGYSSKDIVFATRSDGLHLVSWRGKASIMWNEWKNKFEPFLTNSDSRIIDISKRAIEFAEDNIKDALVNESHEAVFGR